MGKLRNQCAMAETFQLSPTPFFPDMKTWSQVPTEMNMFHFWQGNGNAYKYVNSQIPKSVKQTKQTWSNKGLKGQQAESVLKAKNDLPASFPPRAGSLLGFLHSLFSLHAARPCLAISG
ncbi:hypothetical protein V6N13_039352 [Hibiscus sabdariffa]